jgi:glutamate-1-semialdehyde 2,1-aminomutase
VTSGAAADTIVLPFNDETAVEAAFERDGGRIAAVVVEPYPGNMGLILPRAGYLAKLRDLCTRFGAVLIFDEVMTGFRVARGGVQEREGVLADLTTLGKVIGGGLPVGAFGGKREIMERLAPDGPIYQAGTLSGNPVAMAAGIATMNLIAQDPTLYERFDEASRSLVEGLTGLLRERGVPSYATAAGAMFCLFLADGPVENLDDVRRVDRELFAEFYRAVLECGVYFAPSPYESNFLCAAHTLADLNRTLAYCAAALDEVLENRLPARAGNP